MQKYILRKENYETWIEPEGQAADEYRHIYPNTAFYLASEADARIETLEKEIANLKREVERGQSPNVQVDFYGRPLPSRGL